MGPSSSPNPHRVPEGSGKSNDEYAASMRPEPPGLDAGLSRAWLCVGRDTITPLFELLNVGEKTPARADIFRHRPELLERAAPIALQVAESLAALEGRMTDLVSASPEELAAYFRGEIQPTARLTISLIHEIRETIVPAIVESSPIGTGNLVNDDLLAALEGIENRIVALGDLQRADSTPLELFELLRSLGAALEAPVETSEWPTYSAIVNDDPQALERVVWAVCTTLHRASQEIQADLRDRAALLDAERDFRYNAAQLLSSEPFIKLSLDQSGDGAVLSCMIPIAAEQYESVSALTKLGDSLSEEIARTLGSSGVTATSWFDPSSDGQGVSVWSFSLQIPIVESEEEGNEGLAPIDAPGINSLSTKLISHRIKGLKWNVRSREVLLSTDDGTLDEDATRTQLSSYDGLSAALQVLSSVDLVIANKLPSEDEDVEDDTAAGDDHGSFGAVDPTALVLMDSGGMLSYYQERRDRDLAAIVDDLRILVADGARALRLTSPVIFDTTIHPTYLEISNDVLADREVRSLIRQLRIDHKVTFGAFSLPHRIDEALVLLKASIAHVLMERQRSSEGIGLVLNAFSDLGDGELSLSIQDPAGRLLRRGTCNSEAGRITFRAVPLEHIDLVVSTVTSAVFTILDEKSEMKVYNLHTKLVHRGLILPDEIQTSICAFARSGLLPQEASSAQSVLDGQMRGWFLDFDIEPARRDEARNLLVFDIYE